MKMPELKQFARLQNIEFMSTILRYATIGHVVHEEIQVFAHKKKTKKPQVTWGQVFTFRIVSINGGQFGSKNFQNLLTITEKNSDENRKFSLSFFVL